MTLVVLQSAKPVRGQRPKRPRDDDTLVERHAADATVRNRDVPAVDELAQELFDEHRLSAGPIAQERDQRAWDLGEARALLDESFDVGCVHFAEPELRVRLE